MNLLFQLAASATPTPAGDAAAEIGPGFVGFVATALVVVAVILLIRDMQRRIRRVRYTSEAEARQQQMVEEGKKVQPE